MILVTGANGFLGSEIVRSLRSRGLRVRAVVRNGCAHLDGVEYIAADIRDCKAMQHVMRGVTHVIHSAGLAHTTASLETFNSINRDGTASVVHAAADAGVQRFVLISSVSVYGSRPPRSCSEDEQPRPDTPYAQSKLTAEQIVREVVSPRMSAAILRMATIYGEEDRGNLSHLIRAVIRKRFLPIGDGRNEKTLIYRSDAAEACVLAALSNEAGSDVFNIGTASYRMRDIVECIASHANQAQPRWLVPNSVAFTGRGLLTRLPVVGRRCQRIYERLEKWLAENSYATSKFANAYGFESHMSLHAGISKEVAWLLGQS